MVKKIEAINKTSNVEMDLVKKSLNKDEKKHILKEDIKIADKDKLKIKVDESNKKIADKRIKFEIHEKTNRIIVKLIDKDTDKVIKELPEEEFLEMVAKIEDFIGMFVDERV